MSDPTTRSLTVPETSTSPGPAIAPNTSGDVDGQPAEVVSSHFALPGVKPGSDLDPERFDCFDNGTSAPYCAGRAVEGGEKTISGRLDLAAAEVS